VNQVNHKKLFCKRKKGKKESIRRSGLCGKPKGNGIKEGFCEMASRVYAVVFWRLGFVSVLALLCRLEAANFASFLSLLRLQNSLIESL